MAWPTSTRTKPVGHRVPLRRTVYYHVETRGRIVSSLADFRRLAHASLNDPRGWRVTGTAFKEVRSGGSMTLVLAEASRVPEFSSVCSSSWSCRVGRYVVINQKRWRFASPAWNRYGGSLRGYRHMVVNHETGHWLGHGHRSCPARGALAPVMQQQSISLGGCRFNPFPTQEASGPRPASDRQLPDGHCRAAVSRITLSTYRVRARPLVPLLQRERPGERAVGVLDLAHPRHHARPEQHQRDLVVERERAHVHVARPDHRDVVVDREVLGVQDRTAPGRGRS